MTTSISEAFNNFHKRLQFEGESPVKYASCSGWSLTLSYLKSWDFSMATSAKRDWFCLRYVSVVAFHWVCFKESCHSRSVSPNFLLLGLAATCSVRTRPDANLSSQDGLAGAGSEPKENRQGTDVLRRRGQQAFFDAPHRRIVIRLREVLTVQNSVPSVDENTCLFILPDRANPFFSSRGQKGKCGVTNRVPSNVDYCIQAHSNDHVSAWQRWAPPPAPQNTQEWSPAVRNQNQEQNFFTHQHKTQTGAASSSLLQSLSKAIF